MPGIGGCELAAWTTTSWRASPTDVAVLEGVVENVPARHLVVQVDGLDRGRAEVERGGVAHWNGDAFWVSGTNSTQINRKCHYFTFLEHGVLQHVAAVDPGCRLLPTCVCAQARGIGHRLVRTGAEEGGAGLTKRPRMKW